MSYLRVGPLVRAIATSSVVIWVELTQAGTVTLSAWPDSDDQDYAITISVPTVTVGGHFYAAPQLHGLHPATWYRYTLTFTGQDQPVPLHSVNTPLQYFRTRDQSGTGTTNPLRIAYGSCRKALDAAPDALSQFGSWLAERQQEREEYWPHLLLLIGDQIYADEPGEALVREHPQLQGGATSFEDFTILYTAAWTHDPGAQQVLATIPTYMIFDDHEIFNNWNVDPTWRKRMLEAGKEQLLVDGLVAYWVYQGWGNLERRDVLNHPLLAIMERGAASSEDVLEELRACIRADVYGKTRLVWHYEITTTPPIFVMDARSERTSIFNETPEALTAPTRIVSKEQLAALRSWRARQENGITLLVSSVPILLPPVIGLAEYMMGVRLWHNGPQPLHGLGQKLASLQQRLGNKSSFDHWPFYEESWHDFVQLLTERSDDIVVLSGDVHFSYAIAAHHTGAHAKKAAHSPHLYQLVCTPFQNILDESSQRKVKLQAHIPATTYGKLHTRILPLQPVHKTTQLYANLLFQNSLAMLTVFPVASGYKIAQEYLGNIGGRMDVIAKTVLPDT